MEAIKQFIKERWKPIALFTVLNFFMFYYAFLRENIYYKQYTALFFVFHILFEVVMVIIYAIVKKKKWNIEKIFLALFIPISLAIIFVTPLNQVPDELTHICRVDAISEGKIIATKTENGEYKEAIFQNIKNAVSLNDANPEIYKDTVKEMFASSSEEWDCNYEGAVSYNPIAYEPQIVGVFIGKTLHLPAVFTIYLGRIFAMLTYAAICYFTLKILPKYKYFTLLIMTLPMVIQQTMAFSGDSMLLAVSFLTIACAFKYIYGDDKKLSARQIVSIYVLPIILACCKSVVYLPIAFLFFLIPKEKFKKPFHKWVHIILALVIAAGVSMGWSFTQEATLQNTSSNTDYVLHNPFEFVGVSIGTAFSKDAIDLTKQIFGSSLSYYTYESAQIYIIIFLILAAVLVARNSEKIMTRKMHSLFCWAIPIIITGLLYTVAFTQWNASKPEDYMVSGVQGRYLIAFLPLIPFMLQTNKTKESKNPISLDYVALFIIFANACVIGAKILHNV